MDDEIQRKTRVVAVGNQKGGVGKTAMAVHLAAALGELGRKSLLWDLDANSGLTNVFQIPSDVYSGSLEVLLGLMDEGDEFCDPRNYIIDEEEEGIKLPKGVHVLPASRELDNLDIRWISSERKFQDVKDAIKEPLERLRGEYDYIFLDTGPNVSTCTVGAYKAADWFLLVTEPEPLSVKAVEAALSDIVMVQKAGNPGLNLLGIVLTCVTKRRSLDRKMRAWIEENYEALGDNGLFDSTISRTTFLPRAQAAGQTLFQTMPDHEVCEQFRRLAREIEGRIKSVESDSGSIVEAVEETGGVNIG